MNIQADTQQAIHQGELFRVDGAQAPISAISESFWSSLGKLDSILTAPAPDTIGSMSGERLRVQWWCDPTGQWFAAQVMDCANSGVWEVFLVPGRTGAPFAGKRLCMGSAASLEVLDTVWLEAFAGATTGLVSAGRFPAFAELVAAGSNPSGVSVVRDDTAQVLQLQADVRYWQHLAKSLSKTSVMNEATYAQPPRQNTLPEPPAQAQSTKEWQLSDIGEWAAANADRIVIMPRAIAATKRSTFEQPALLFECLELLATEYTQVKTGKADRFAFKNKAESLGLDFGGSVEPSVAGEMGDLYFVRWHGRRQFLDQHLCKGNARDPRFCMRIYFFYDEDTQKVIVGHMPSHLPTSTS